MLLLEHTQWEKKWGEIWEKDIPFTNTWRLWYHKSKPAITTVLFDFKDS